MAEHLPNEWQLTNLGGPMDTEWCDEFHDRLVDACRGAGDMGRLADALKLTHTACDDWYKATNYAESHDEVGNVNDRIANVAGPGRGLRMAKVAAAATLLARGIPMLFMGSEAGEHRQFRFGSGDPLGLEEYLARDDLRRVRAWWNVLLALRRSESIKGPAPLDVRLAEGQMLAFTRGLGADYYVLLHFGGASSWQPAVQLNLPHGIAYRELWNSTWPAFAVESEDEHTNGGREARIGSGSHINVPDHGAVVLERV
jgi:1,4-alpha-glucan branching enzyme